MNNLEYINCPLCGNDNHTFWATENGFNCVRCGHCGLLYVTPLPNASYIEESVKLGGHVFEDGKQLNTKTRRMRSKQRHFERIVKQLFPDLLNRTSVAWLDVGAGYGEFVQALLSVLSTSSVVEGLEPMTHKVEKAREFNLPVRQGFLSDVTATYDVVSIIDVFSHIPDFPEFLSSIKSVLNSDGEILVKTGNAAEIGKRSNFPGALNLPDHLMFGGGKQLTQFFEDAGFTVIGMEVERIDGMWYSFKNLAKYILGKPVSISLPYTSPTRTIWMRARLNTLPLDRRDEKA